MRKIIFALFFLFLASLSAYAEDNPQAMLVFDASGSMWGQINGKPKIGIAKNALNKVITDWNEDIHLGLIAYGHRKKGDCSDIQTLVPIGALNKKDMVSKVDAIKPKGKTPISASLKKAAKNLRYTEEKATIILISDGKETCNADPCATAKALKSEGIDFITHVIGFDVDKQTDKQLKCIADATGGEYFSAKNASSLNNAIGKIAEKVQKEEPKPSIVKDLKVNLQITATEIEGGKWINEASHTIYSIEDGEKKRITYCYSYKKEACSTKVPVGKYTLESSYNKLKKETPFEVKAGEVTQLNIIMGQTGKVEISASEKEKGKWVEANHNIYTIEDGEKSRVTYCYSYKKKACLVQIPVGKYSLESTFNKFKQETPFEVKFAEVTKLKIIMGQTGKVEISASEKEKGKWVEANHNIYTIEDGEKSRVTYCYSYKKKACLVQIPVGKYTLESTFNKFKQETPFEVKFAEVTKLKIVMGQTGKVEISASEKEKGKWVEANHNIYTIEDGEKSRVTYCYSYKKKACLVQIPVGKYTLESTFKQFKKETPFEIKFGKVTELHITFSQFVIHTKCPNMGSNVSYEIYASNGQLVFEKKSPCSKPVNVVLEQGSYTLTTIVENQNKDTKFSISADHPNQITVNMQEETKEPVHQDLIDADKQDHSSQKTDKTPQDNDTRKKTGATLKETISIAIPKYKSSIECYQKSADLVAVKACEVIEKEMVEQVKKAFQQAAGVKSDQEVKIKQHSQWDDEIKQQTLAQKQHDLKKMQLSFSCLDQGADFAALPACIKNDGKYKAKK